MAVARRSNTLAFRAAILAAAAVSGGGLAWVRERSPRSSLPVPANVAPMEAAMTLLPARTERAVVFDRGVEGDERSVRPDSDDAVPRSGAPSVGSACPQDMVAVEGQYCPEVEQTCLEWAPDDRHRCLRFREPSVCRGTRRPLSFCVDRYEWPNRAGARPVVMATWIEARRACRSVGKRLCSMEEWTFACEGEQMLPYPYGYAREPGACTTDHRARAPIRRLLNDLSHAVSFAEAARVYEAAPSGAANGCASPFGAYDMAGNVDEWTVNTTGVPYRSALKGGWWGRVRARCRPSTLGHYESFRYYNIGFRCCASAQGSGAAAE